MPRTTGRARERVLAAADELFYARGIHAVGVNEIVERAGVAKTSLYLHFESKDELVATYLAGRVELYEGLWRQIIDDNASASPRELLDAIFDALDAYAQSEGYRGCPFQLAAAELAIPDGSAPGVESISAYRRFVRDELFGAVAERAHIVDHERLREQLRLLYDAALDCSFADGTPAPVERARETAHLVLEQALRERDA